MRPFSVALAALLILGASRASAEVTFVIDPRVESLSVALLLADPAASTLLRPAPNGDYAASARAAFGSYAGHAAVVRLASLRREGRSLASLAAAAVQTASDPKLALLLADFRKASGFDAFYAAHRADYQAFVETARRESLRTVSAEDALAYMGARAPSHTRFILAPLLSPEPALEDLHLRGATLSEGKVAFGFDGFETSVAAVLSRDALSWLKAPRRELSAHLAAAVALRLVARDLGERAYRTVLNRRLSESLPQLEGVAEGLRAYEAARVRYRTLRDFVPQLSALATLRLNQARSAASAGRRTEAVALLDDARRYAPDPATAASMVLAYQDHSELKPARELQSRLVADAPLDAERRVELAAIEAGLGARPAALSALAAAAKLKPGAETRLRMAQIHQDLKDYGAALSLLAELARERPDDAGLTERLGVCHFLAGRPDEAVASLRAAISRAPTSLSAYHSLGSIFAAQRRFDEELAVYDALPSSGGDPGLREAIGRNRQVVLTRLHSPMTRPEAPLERASRMAREGKREQALAGLAEAVAKTEDVAIHRGAAKLYAELDEIDEARALLAGVFDRFPRDPASRVDLAELEAGLGRREQALTALDAAGERDPQEGDRRRMALVRQNLKDYAGALGLLEPLARERPKDSGLHESLGVCLFLAGRAEDAVQSLKTALALDPGALSAVLSLGTVYASLGRTEDELAVYDAVPPGTARPDLRQALAQARKAADARRKR